MAKSSINIDLPQWWEDPLYAKTQDYLFPYGKNILEGNLPDFYSTLGKTGTPEFENILSLINRDTANAISESNVRRNVSRGGVGLSTLARTTADVGTKLRWEDFLRANTEKQWLMGTGLNTLSGVRGAALDITGQRNQFNLNRSGLELNLAQANAQAKQQKDAMWSSILSSAIGAAGTIGGMALLGPAGGMLGAAAGSGISNIGSQISAPTSSFRLLS